MFFELKSIALLLATYHLVFVQQEYKRRSTLRDSYTETEVVLLRAPSAASVASGATDRSGNTDNCVEEYVCDVPFAGKSFSTLFV